MLLALAVAAVGFFIWDYNATKAENKRLESELVSANTAIEQLGMKLDAEANITINRDEMIRSIRNAPESDDGPIAPVLRNVIEQLQ